MYERVLVGTDGSLTADRAVEAAALIARAHGSELIIAHAFPARPTVAERVARSEAPDEVKWRLSPGAIAEALVQSAVDQARTAVGGDRQSLWVRGRCEPGAPIPVLLGLIDELDPDALVIGNRDMPGRIRIRRSVARTLAHRATCDVVVVDTVGRRDERRRRRAAAGAHELRWA